MSSADKNGRAVLLPVKALRKAKSRLAEVCTPDERQRLAWALFQDVRDALQSCCSAERLCVVSTDAEVLKGASQAGWMALVEGPQHSESASVDLACRYLETRGFQAVLRLPADLPLLQSRDVDQILEAARPASALLVPSRDGTGTNALLRNPPTAFPSFFGPGSLQRHMHAAGRAGLSVTVAENARLALDLDTPQDVMTFLRKPRSGHTLRALEEMNLGERLKRFAK